jgi:hypothetical protein
VTQIEKLQNNCTSSSRWKYKTTLQLFLEIKCKPCALANLRIITLIHSLCPHQNKPETALETLTTSLSFRTRLQTCAVKNWMNKENHFYTMTKARITFNTTSPERALQKHRSLLRITIRPALKTQFFLHSRRVAKQHLAAHGSKISKLIAHSSTELSL